MEEENIKQEGKRGITMVECPFCNQPIEAPDKADVIFTCPNCHKELITYDKSRDSGQGIGKSAKTHKANYQTLKWGCIAAFISLSLLYAHYTNNSATQDSSQKIYMEESGKYTKSTERPPKTEEQTNKQHGQTEERGGKYQEIATWEGHTFSNDKCSYTLLKQADGKLRLRENSTDNLFDCTKYIIKNSTDYYFVDPEIADINVNLACFNLKKGATIYIIHNFDYDSTEQQHMDGILVPFGDNNARIYLDLLANGTAYYCNNGNPPISRLNEHGALEYYNSDGSNEPAYECYAKLH